VKNHKRSVPTIILMVMVQTYGTDFSVWEIREGWCDVLLGPIDHKLIVGSPRKVVGGNLAWHQSDPCWLLHAWTSRWRTFPDQSRRKPFSACFSLESIYVCVCFCSVSSSVFFLSDVLRMCSQTSLSMCHCSLSLSFHLPEEILLWVS